MLDIPIVVAAFNRKEPLERLLMSLNKALYPGNIKLFISVDGGEGNADTVSTAEQFEWKHGEKELIVSDTNLGLRAHILKCGKLAEVYDGIVLLEDDLYVSPYFYSYIIQAHEKYGNDPTISGIALYSHQYNETACLPFRPIDDGYDVFFMQIACSWGQSWLGHQWSSFETWYDKNKEIDLSSDASIPPDVRMWPATSWKKYFLKYLIENDKYFVYPRISLTTNFADPGVNHMGSNIFQVPLLYRGMEYSLPVLNDSLAKYDAYCEIIPECLSGVLQDAIGKNFEVDLYGMKRKCDIKTDYVLTTQGMHAVVKSFARKLKPLELNIFENLSGDEIHLGSTAEMSEYASFIRHRNEVNQDYRNTHMYFYQITKEHYKPADQQEKLAIYRRIFWRVKSMLRFFYRSLKNILH